MNLFIDNVYILIVPIFFCSEMSILQNGRFTDNQILFFRSFKTQKNVL